jgi:phenylacetate-CoA ligase
MSMIRKALWAKKLNAQGDTVNKFKELQQWQWLSPKEVVELQNQRLQEILNHAYINVPYYSDVLKSLVNMEGEINLNDFKKVPFLTKEILTNQFSNLQSIEKSSRKWFKDSSGGSTGQPVSFIKDNHTTEWAQAIKLLDNQWSSLEVGERQIRLWGSERDLLVGKESFKTMIGRKIRNELWLNAFKMTNEDMESYIYKINVFKPKQILAYAGSVYELARFVKRNNLKVFNPTSIMTSAGTLYPHMRKLIEEVFQCPVFNRYGSREVGDIACECDHHQGLHISARTHYIEIVSPDGSIAKPGEVGEIVVTSLVNYSMPLIRYKIGDLGILSEAKCNCGRGLPLLKEVTGRVTDAFIKEDGSVVVPEYIIHMVGVSFYSDIIKKFQVIQEEINLVTVLIEADNKISESNEFKTKQEEIVKQIQLVMGKKCIVNFKIVQDIPPTSSGKYRYIVSKINTHSM